METNRDITAKEILQAALEKIRAPSRWTQRTFARSVSGRSVDFASKAACCWCALGAVYSVGGPVEKAIQAEDALKMYCDRAMRTSVARYNDAIGTTHADVLALFEATIAGYKETAPCDSFKPS